MSQIGLVLGIIYTYYCCYNTSKLLRPICYQYFRYDLDTALEIKLG
jgi:hypothetical protein